MKNILLIDDDKVLTKRNRAYLEYVFGEIANIFIALTVKAAIELAKNHRIDIFVIDILGLGDEMDGVELAEYLQSNGYPYPVPMIIASKQKDDTFKNEVHKRIKFYDYTTKPYTQEELAAQIKYAIEFLDYQPTHYFEMSNGSLPYRQESKTISHIEKVYDKRKVGIYRRDELGKSLPTHLVPIVSFKSFVKESVEISIGFVQCSATTVINLYWVERYCRKEKNIILRICGTKIPVDKSFRERIEKLVPID